MKIFTDYNKKQLKSFQKTLFSVNSLEEQIKKLSDEELKKQTEKFKDALKNGKKLGDILPEGFACVREAAFRALGMRHFDSQIIGGITIHNGMIAEMATGEGKTLVCTLPAYLNALLGKGVHVVTVNDYLAKRDAKWMEPIYNMLGLEVGIITAETKQEDRKKEYEKDITYATNNELGFDYLRDNMANNKEQIVMRGLNFAIIDEVDSILIDEARTPLIISGGAEDKSEIYKLINSFVRFFETADYTIDAKAKTVNLTDSGTNKFERLLHQSIKMNGSLFDSHNIFLFNFLTQSLKAHFMFKKDVDYIVHNNEVMIIDEFTGRVMEGRRYGQGLHQAIEAKEKLPIKSENRTLASITYQNYFNMYKKISGMTGTAATEKLEFEEIYNLPVIQIPSNRPIVRKDYNDAIYIDKNSKLNMIVEQIKKCYEKSQPVLVGTISIESSEEISELLKKHKLPHSVLNAKNHEKEAKIIENAGLPNAITIATNMAGRGTDIKLGGVYEKDPSLTEEENQKNKQKWEENNKIVKESGGLFVIGTERHESRRIDNQLRGRSGRQGDAGASLFFLALDDHLLKVFGTNKMQGMFKKLGVKENEVISHKWISNAIAKAQKKVEQYNFDIRKNLLNFDNVVNEQRKIIYEQRHDILFDEGDIFATVEEIAKTLISENIATHADPKLAKEQWDFEILEENIKRIFNIDIKKLKTENLEEEITKIAKARLKEKEQELGKENFKFIMNNICLQTIDYLWMEHLSALDNLKNSINLRAYANKDPLNEYKKEALEYFGNMFHIIEENIATIAFNSTFQEEEEDPIIENSEATQKIGRNEPCFCGSGKKYKHCHGK